MADRGIALIGIIVTDGSPTEKLNAILHDYSDLVIGRMGVPYHKEKLNIISVAVDGPLDAINAMSGKLGRLPGITTKTVYAARRNDACANGEAEADGGQH